MAEECGMAKIEADLSGVVWRRSSTSESGDEPCIEVALAPGSKEGSEHVIAVRDSRHPDGPALIFTPAEWEAFTAGVREGEFDLDSGRHRRGAPPPIHFPLVDRKRAPARFANPAGCVSSEIVRCASNDMYGADLVGESQGRLRTSPRVGPLRARMSLEGGSTMGSGRLTGYGRQGFLLVLAVALAAGVMLA